MTPASSSRKAGIAPSLAPFRRKYKLINCRDSDGATASKRHRLPLTTEIPREITDLKSSPIRAIVYARRTHMRNRNVAALTAVFALTTSVSVSIPRPVQAHGILHKTCFCDAVYVDSNQNITKVIGFSTGLEFHVPVPTTGNRGDCRNKCALLYDQNHAAITTAACSANLPDNADIRAAWWIGNQNANQVRNNRLQVTYGRYCPIGWLSNTSNVDGGVTYDGMCKKEFAITSTTPPMTTPVTPPPNGTHIGSWGFWWNGALIAYGTPQNGGAAGHPNTSTQKVCKLI